MDGMLAYEAPAPLPLGWGTSEARSLLVPCVPSRIALHVPTVETGLITHSLLAFPFSHFPSHCSPSISRYRLPNKPLTSKSLSQGWLLEELRAKH